MMVRESLDATTMISLIEESVARPRRLFHHSYV